MTLTIKEPSPMDTVTKPAPGTPDASTDQNSRSNPVCLELAVTVRSLPGEKGDAAAKPIREEGRTVIVFDGGAVLRISTSLPPGQSVIVSNPQGRDVVCRVVSARGLPTVKGYIEVEFAEQVNDFWGIHGTGAQTVAKPAVPTPVSKPQAPPVAPPPVAAKKISPPPPAPRSATPALPDAKAAKGNAPQFEDIAGLVRMSTPPGARVKKPEAPSNLAASKVAEAPARPAPEAPKPAPANSVSQREEAQDLVSGAWESAPTSGRKSTSSDSVIAKDMFSSAGTDSVSSDGGSQAKTPLIAAAAAVVLIAAGGGWYFMHRGSSSSTPAPISAATQPSSPSPAPEAKAPEAAPVAAIPSANSSVATPAAPTAPVASASATATPSPVAQNNRRMPNNVAASQPAAPAPRNQPVLNLNMAAPTAASRNAGRLVDGSVPNIADPVAANPIIATTSGASLPSIARTDNPPAPPVANPAATAPARTIREPKLISAPRLSYPPTAKQTKVEGDVLVTADVDATGKVTSAKAVSGPQLLRVGAEDTVKGWKYDPATINGRPVATQVTVKLEFHLK